MSSLSGAHFDADLPATDAAVAAGVSQTGSREAELLRKARDGDRAAYGQLVSSCQDRLFNAVLRLVGDHEEARDLTQEAFTRGLMKVSGYRGEAQPYTWLFRIAMNLAISGMRKVGRRRTFSLDRPVPVGGSTGDDDQASALLDRVAQDRGDGPSEAAERRERQAQVVAALGRLDPEERAVLVMRDVEGFDYQQMADVLGVPLGTLKSRLFRARVSLRGQLAAYMEGNPPKRPDAE